MSKTYRRESREKPKKVPEKREKQTLRREIDEFKYNITLGGSDGANNH